MNDKQLKQQKEKSLEIIDKMIGELQNTRAAIEYDKKVKPYFYLVNSIEEKGIITHSLGNLDLLTIVGLLESFKTNSFLNKK